MMLLLDQVIFQESVTPMADRVILWHTVLYSVSGIFTLGIQHVGAHYIKLLLKHCMT